MGRTNQTLLATGLQSATQQQWYNSDTAVIQLGMWRLFAIYLPFSWSRRTSCGRLWLLDWHNEAVNFLSRWKSVQLLGIFAKDRCCIGQYVNDLVINISQKHITGNTNTTIKTSTIHQARCSVAAKHAWKTIASMHVCHLSDLEYVIFDDGLLWFFSMCYFVASSQIVYGFHYL